jgi:hypothetical protein
MKNSMSSSMKTAAAMKWWWLVLLAGALSVVLGCGTEDPQASAGDDGGSDALGGGTGPYLPWAVGNSWTYQVDELGVLSTKVTTVGALEPVGGNGPHAATMANQVTTTKGASDRTVSWQAPLGDLIVRFREQAFQASTGQLAQEEHWSPPKLHLDMGSAHVVAGASWLEVYEETKQPVTGTPSVATARDRWTVLAVDQEVTVPAGTFRALVLQKAGGSTAKQYWYVRGVGKVKETGGQTEKLVSYQVEQR